MSALEEQKRALRALKGRLEQNSRFMTAKTLQQVAEIQGPRQYLYAIMEDLERKGYISFLENKSQPHSYGHKFRITAEGIDYINSFNEGGSYDSSRWTGVRRISAHQKAIIILKVDELFEVVNQSLLGDIDKSNALAHIQAVKILLGAPDTPWRQVIDLLNSRHLNGFMTVANILMLIFGS